MNETQATRHEETARVGLICVAFARTICPHCQSMDTRVDAGPMRRGIRYHECRKCGRRFASVER